MAKGLRNGFAMAIVALVVHYVDCSFYSEVPCPTNDDPNTPVFFQTDDCSKYYRCLRGSGIIQTCPDGLHWNPTKSICDYPWEAECAATTRPPDLDLDDVCTPALPAACLASDKGPNWKALIENHPHPSDCKWYYTCSRGIAFCLKCEDGLYYNPIAEKCDSVGENDCKTTKNKYLEYKYLPPTNWNFRNNFIT